jgi:hypothetical protein
VAVVKNPVRFTAAFRINRKHFEATGALDPILNADTRLFIDPLLIRRSAAPELKDGAARTIESHYADLVKLIQASKVEGDVPWRQAVRLVSYHEIPATCLGYGAATVRGSGPGAALSTKLLRTAAEIVRLGLTDPDLFLMLPLLEEGVGPDLISDMTTSIISQDLATYTRRILAPFDVPLARHRLLGVDTDLPTNPRAPGLPVLLVPKDVLDSLPVATNSAEVADAAAKNTALRRRVNQYYGDLLRKSTAKPDKPALRRVAVSSMAAAEALLDALKAVVPAPYDTTRDPEAKLALQRALEGLEAVNFSDSELPKDPVDPWQTVVALTERFQHLVERKGLWKLLWNEDKPHHERMAQMLYLAVADSYCRANDLDLTPEAGTGSGPVDFKLSRGYDLRLLVEIKLSTNSKVVEGYTKQLQLYKESEEALRAMYVVVDVGQMGNKDQRLLDARRAALASGDTASEVLFVDGTRKRSASKA